MKALLVKFFIHLISLVPDKYGRPTQVIQYTGANPCCDCCKEEKDNVKLRLLYMDKPNLNGNKPALHCDECFENIWAGAQ